MLYFMSFNQYFHYDSVKLKFLSCRRKDFFKEGLIWILRFTPRLEVYSESSDMGTFKWQTAINDTTNTDTYRNSLRDPRLFA